MQSGFVIPTYKHQDNNGIYYYSLFPFGSGEVKTWVRLDQNAVLGCLYIRTQKYLRRSPPQAVSKIFLSAIEPDHLLAVLWDNPFAAEQESDGTIFVDRIQVLTLKPYFTDKMLS